MASIKEHCQDCKEKLGESFKEVHYWLDEYARIYWPKMMHRVHRHHAEGIEEVRLMWGDEAAKAAELHIIKDEGCIPTEEEIRKKYCLPPKKYCKSKGKENGQ